MMAAQHVARRGHRYPHPELGAFTGDAHVSPARVVPGQATHQLDRFVAKPAALRSVRLGPVAPDQLTVPAQQGGRRDEEDAPAITREKPGQHRQQATIGVVETGTRNLALQDRQLVAQHGDLDVLVVGLRADAERAQDTPQDQETHGEPDQAPSPHAPSWLLTAMILKLHPTSPPPSNQG
jgi:hypothetical protein